MRIKKFLILNSSFLICFLVSFLIPSAAFAALNASATSTPSGANSLSGVNSGLVGYWTMDGKDINWTTNTIVDRSGNGNTASTTALSKATSTVQGKIGQALSFNGLNSYLDAYQVAQKGYLNSDVTISVWYNAKATTTTYGGCIVCQSYPGYGVPDVGMKGVQLYYTAGNQLDAKVYGSSVSIDIQSGQVVKNKWHHLVLIIQGTQLSFYQDGLSVGTPKTITSRTTETNLWIGGEKYLGINSGNGPSWFNGSIDDVRIYNRALSVAEVQQLYNQTAASKINSSATTTASTNSLSGINSGLVGYWTMDGKDTIWSGPFTGAIIDRSGKGSVGTLINMGRATSTAIGQIGQSLNFDGTNSYISMPNGPYNQFGTTDFTIASWIKTKDTGNQKCIASITAGAQGWRFGYQAGKPYFLIGDASNYKEGVVGTATLNDGKWHHLTTIYSRTQSLVQAYIDGRSVGTSSISNVTGSVSYSGNTPAIGAMYAVPTALKVNGSIDDVRLYNRALSPGEVQQLYNQTAASKINASATTTAGTNSLSGINSGLVGYWTMDGKDINWTTNTMIDRSGKGNTGSLYALTKATSTAQGKIGQALRFASSTAAMSGSYIDIGNVLNAPAQISVSAWVNLAMIPINSKGIVSKGGLSQGGYRLYLPGSSAVAWQAVTSGGSGIFTVTTGALSLNKWYLVTGTYNGSVGNIYLNGVLINTNSTASGNITTQAANNLIGTLFTSGNNWINSSIDDVRIYNRALSPTEVLQMYNQGR